MLKNDNGEWDSDKATLKGAASAYFQELFSTDTLIAPPYPYNGLFPQLNPDRLQSLDSPISMEEVKRALFDMHPFKAPGIDGLHAAFFQTFWEVTGDTLFHMIREFFCSGALDPSINRTLISLIPKVAVPQSLKDFRPISLCNTVYKVITKLVSNRLKSFMPDLVLPAQTSFIKGRNITENVILAQNLYIQ